MERPEGLQEGTRGAPPEQRTFSEAELYHPLFPQPACVRLKMMKARSQAPPASFLVVSTLSSSSRILPSSVSSRSSFSGLYACGVACRSPSAGTHLTLRLECMPNSGGGNPLCNGKAPLRNR